MIKREVRVTEPDLPDIEQMLPLLEKMWDEKWITNGGPFHQQLEKELKSYLKIKNLSLTSNGTLALLLALSACGVRGEVITTPYSFVATGHSILWNNLKPVFVDIDPKTLNLDPKKIESNITPETTAILPVHCYGNPCDTFEIQKVAERHGLRVIYDAAHCFGVELANGGILEHGDLSALSFHATKCFNTFEGGAVVCSSPDLKKIIEDSKNFGFENETSVVSVGINAKLNEFSSAVGLLQLANFEKLRRKRQLLDEYYRKHLLIKGIRCFEYSKTVTKPNYGYFPIFVEDEYPLTRDQLYDRLKENGILARRYFYPLISNFPVYQKYETASKEHLPLANDVANKVLCLPIFSSLETSSAERVIDVVLGA